MDNIIVKTVGKLLTGLKLAAGSLAGRVMGALGLTWVNFAFVLPEVKQWLAERTSGMPDNVVNFLSAIGLDVFMVMVVSAVVARAGMRTITTSVAALEGLVGQESGA